MVLLHGTLNFRLSNIYHMEGNPPRYSRVTTCGICANCGFSLTWTRCSYGLLSIGNGALEMQLNLVVLVGQLICSWANQLLQNGLIWLHHWRVGSPLIFWISLSSTSLIQTRQKPSELLLGNQEVKSSETNLSLLCSVSSLPCRVSQILVDQDQIPVIYIQAFLYCPLWSLSPFHGNSIKWLI